MRGAACLPAFLVLLLAGPGSAAEFRRLHGREIVGRFAGAALSDGTHWTFRFARGGRLASVTLGRPRTGTWRVEGDRLCTTGGPGSADCHEVWAAGSAVQLRRDGAPPEEGSLTRSR